MDGFHYVNKYLISSGLLERKGAIQTFDYGGFYHTLKRIYDRDEIEVAVPVFDRKIEISRSAARIINSRIPIIIVEGNYLLIDVNPWPKLRINDIPNAQFINMNSSGADYVITNG